MSLRLLIWSLLFAAASVLTAQAQDADQDAASIARGAAFAQSHCARCHAIGRTGDSPLKQAPPFRTLHERYPVENLQEALGEGILTGHPEMPEFELDPDQIDDFLVYLNSLQ